MSSTPKRIAATMAAAAASSNAFIRRATDSDDVDEESSLLDRGQEQVRRFWQGFIDFAMQGNMLEFAFGLILANAFTDLIQEFVTDILMPPISFLMPVRRNMEEKFWVLHYGSHYDNEVGYNTLQQARADGAVVMAYGLFINSAASFMFMGMVLYLTAVIYSKLTHDNIIKHSVKCRYCRKRIHDKALRCIHCSSWVDGREDRWQQ